MLQAIYICTIIVQFTLALGIQPRAARLSYFVSFCIFGVHIAAGILHLAFFTSYAQHPLIVSSYTNAPNTYAFKDSNDNPWGHKGSCLDLILQGLAIF